jgi:heme-degrading monooxygenase HmoA
MILEVAPLQVKPREASRFEVAFLQAQRIIASMPGYISHDLQRCIERPNEYLLLVVWQTLEDHEVGFRHSAQYQEWKKLLHHFYEPFPVVSHYRAVDGASSAIPAIPQPCTSQRGHAAQANRQAGPHRPTQTEEHPCQPIARP